MACQMARYINLGSHPIKFAIGSAPGVPWTRYDSAPGGVVEGPAGYLRAFSDAGYTLVTPDIQAMLDAEAARAAAPKVDDPPAQVQVEFAKVEVTIDRAEEPAADPDRVGLNTIVSVDPPPAQPVATVSEKGRRRGRNQ